MHTLRQLSAFSLLTRPLSSSAVPRLSVALYPKFSPAPSATLRSWLSLRAFSLSRTRLEEATKPSPPPSQTPSPDATGFAPTPQTRIALETSEPRLSLTFTCTVEGCRTRSTHQFTKRSYEKGIVIVECPGCKNRHLIADHLGWFKESTEDGKLKTVEDLLRAKGEKVKRGRIDAGGVVEYAPE